ASASDSATAKPPRVSDTACVGSDSTWATMRSSAASTRERMSAVESSSGWWWVMGRPYIAGGLSPSLPSRQPIEQGQPGRGIVRQRPGGEAAAFPHGEGAGGARHEGLDLVGDHDHGGAGGDQMVDPDQEVLAGAAVHGFERLLQARLAGGGPPGRGAH